MGNEQLSLESVLNEPNVIALILFLDEEGKSYTTGLTKVSKSLRKLQDTADGLETYGIVKISVVNTPRRTITYELTDKGKKLAKALRAAVAIAEE
jgi:DNA-binding HxlR family transcriptional regulator